MLILTKSVKNLVASIKVKDKQIAFIMEKITTLIEEKSNNSNQKQHLSLHEEGENSANEVSQNQ